jgi:hypothetical protein
MTTIMLAYAVGGIALTLIGISLYLGKMKPNGRLYGFRVGAALENPEVWYQVNKYGARWLVMSGIISFLTGVGLFFVPGLSLGMYALACIVIFGGVFIFGLVMTVRYMNSL